MDRSHLFAAGLAFGALAAAAQAQVTLHVATCGDDAWSGLSDVCQAPNGPKRSIQGAIDTAQGGDTVLVLPGTHTGPGNRNLNFNGKAIALRSRDGAAETTIDLQGVLFGDEAILVKLQNNEGPGTLIQGFTVLNGSREGESIIDMRGGASLVLRDSIFRNHTVWGYPGSAPEGGIVYAPGCEVTVERCEFYGPVLDGEYPSWVHSAGGYIYALDTNLTLRDCTFDGGWADRGGAVYFEGYPDDGPEDCVMERCAFRNLSGLHGAGAQVHSADMVLMDGCIFEDNLAQMPYCFEHESYTTGGAALLHGDRVYVRNCTVVRNSCLANACRDYMGAFVGGMGVGATTFLEVSNCLFAGNIADDDEGLGRAGEAGGIRLAIGSGGSATVVDCTITGNRARVAGAGIQISAAAPNVELSNVVVYGNDGEEIDGPAQFLSVAYSDIEGGYPGDGNIDAAPMFMDGANGDFRLDAGSPCIDAGDNTAVPLSYPDLPEDLAGEPRFRDDPATADTGVGVARVVDMGAYEFQPGPFCRADFNDDGATNTLDFIDFFNAWNAGEPTANLFPDEALNTLDVIAFLNFWNSGC